MTRPPTDTLAEALVAKRGNVFLTSPRDSQWPAAHAHPHGLWYRDCRFLSAHELRVNGEAPIPLQASDGAGWRAVHDLTSADGSLLVEVTRELSAAGVLRELIAVTRLRGEAGALSLELRLGADFAPMLDLRGIVERPTRPSVSAELDGATLRFATEGRDAVTRTTTVRLNLEPGAATLTPGPAALATLRFEGADELALEVAVSEGGHPARRASAPAASGPRISSDDELFDRVLARSLADLDLLRSELDGFAYYAAGVPWYVTLFGRDSLITARQMLPLAPEVAADTLRLLAALQGSTFDEVRAEQPGRILHELRVGEPAALGETPFARYYASADATPLWLCLLVDHSDWSGSLDLFRELRPQVDAALAWIEREADPLIRYSAAPGRGLVNQGWRDSADGVPDDSGGPLRLPIALVEVQGYAVRALRGVAGLLERDGDGSQADHLRGRAELAEDALERFWLGRAGSYAIGLDADDRPGSAQTSNPGHLLWARAVSPERAGAVRDVLMGDALFSGWGVRTLAQGHAGYNPLGYHTGSVWPHDNSLIAAGLREYGFDADFERLANALLEAASRFPDYRLPELFGGQSRRPDDPPVPYPVACRPQAWAAGSIPYLLTTGLGLRPAGLDGRLHVVGPTLPAWVGSLAIEGLRVAGATVDLRFERNADGVALADARVDGRLELVVGSSEWT